MLFRTLNIGATGLRVSQSALSTIGHNIANVDVEGYSRQRVELEANIPNVLGYRPSQYGTGAHVTTVGRAHVEFYDRQARLVYTSCGFYEGRSTTLDAVQRLYGAATEPDLGGAFDEFFNKARELTQEPSDNSVRQSFLQAAQNVAQAFNVLDRELRSLRTGIDDNLTDKLGEVNELARTIAGMNAKIVAGELDDQQANDYRDIRDQAVRELSKLVDVNTLPQPDGSLTVEIQRGNVLVQGDQFARLQGTPNAANAGLLDVEYVGINNTVVNLTQVLNQGEIGGLLDVRDQRLSQDMAALDTLAQTFATAVNAQHQAGFGLDGLNNRALFLPPVAPPGTAGNLSVDPLMVANPQFVAASATALTLPGDNRNLQLLADLQNTPQAGIGNVTFNRRFGQLVHDVGLTAADNEKKLSAAKVKSEQSEALRESVAGVSVDDEMVDLTRFQKAFEANSKIVSTVDQLLDTVIALVD